VEKNALLEKIIPEYYNHFLKLRITGKMISKN